MPNMSYCRFHNTLSDLHDCFVALEELENFDPEDFKAWKKRIKELDDKGDEITDMEEEEYFKLEDWVREAERSGLSKEEAEKAASLINMCRDISKQFGDTNPLEYITE